MTAIIDDHGRVEIPAELRDRLHLQAGMVVNFEQNGNGLYIAPTVATADNSSQGGRLVQEGSLLIIDTDAGTVTVEDVNRVRDQIYQGRIDRFLRQESAEHENDV